MSIYGAVENGITTVHSEISTTEKSLPVLGSWLQFEMLEDYVQF